ncbi:Proline-rich early nodulin [Colletotrichum higginsianum IMI 349063]|uniref:Proline-rich early nodulin n=3 Tax=Colletotrichum higginsianum TaxID=80884 RepID=A0A1B7YIS8_COLHI|nr:Proline-rich early nodulin [Colletotrichum higginsianum IMI 349063]OBR11890.1 Proline-rich early nodulin [Colletotrichum higginsianum IMI 349063]TIC99739.1 hypothetical protein CH35J_005950 [Colletotrichum higginsianum]
MAPAPVDIEMADCASFSSSASGLSPPSFPGASDCKDLPRRAREDSPDQPSTSLEHITLDSPITGTELANMRRSARNSNKPRPVAVTSPSRPAKRKITTRVVKKEPKWTAAKLLTDPKSPLASADLRTILCQPAAWDILSKEERAEIIALLPAGTRILDPGTDDARPDLDALRNDNNFRHDCATYTNNIAQGKHDPEWLEQAWAARERRRAGDFDGYLKQKFEDEWSCELPEGFRPKRDGDKPAKGVAVAEEEGKAEAGGVVNDTTTAEEANILEAYSKNSDGAEEAQVPPEAPKIDAKVAHGGELEEEHNIKLGSPTREEVRVELGSPIPESPGEDKVQQSGEKPVLEEQRGVSAVQEDEKKSETD